VQRDGNIAEGVQGRGSIYALKGGTTSVLYSESTSPGVVREARPGVETAEWWKWGARGRRGAGHPQEGKGAEHLVFV